jgi:hypothetical protein
MSKMTAGAYGIRTADRWGAGDRGVAVAVSKSGTAVTNQFSTNKRMIITTILLRGMIWKVA